jgi:hypothetical protein
MANTVTVTKLQDGERHAIFHVFIKSDGSSGDMVDQVIIDPAIDFDPALPLKPCMTVCELWYDLSGFDARLDFSYLTSDTPAWTLSAGNGVHMDFTPFAGLKDRSGSLDGTGKLMVSTNGLTAAGDNGTIVIKVRKD